MLADANAQSLPNVPTIGITYGMSDDFTFASDDPWDWDAEFEVSMAMGDITGAIEDLGFPTVVIGSAADLLDGFSEYSRKAHMAFNIADGKLGRAIEPQMPGIFEAGGMTYVGSNSETFAIALNRTHAKYNAIAHHIRTPEFAIISDVADIRQDEIPEYPVILKPTHGRSSMDINEKVKIRDFGQLKKHARYILRTYGRDVMVERFIDGCEYDVAIIGTDPSEVFGVVEVTLNGSPMGANHLTPKMVYNDSYGFGVADADGDIAEAKSMALAAYNSLKCRDFGSVDIRVEGSTGRPYFLGLNPYPYLGRHGSFAHIAKGRGMEYMDVIGAILDSAMQRRR